MSGPTHLLNSDCVPDRNGGLRRRGPVVQGAVRQHAHLILVHVRLRGRDGEVGEDEGVRTIARKNVYRLGQRLRTTLRGLAAKLLKRSDGVDVNATTVARDSA